MRRFLGLMLAATAATTALGGGLTGFTLEDRNSTVTIDLEGFGVEGWTVDNSEMLNTQWFWTREGNATRENSLSDLPLLGAFASDTNPFIDDRFDTLSTRFGDLNGITYDVSFRIQGGNLGSGAADMAETIVISNHSNASRSVSFFQYSDFDLNDTALNDTAVFVNSNVFRQSDPNSVFNETVVTPAPSAYQAALFPVLFAALQDNGLTNLTNDGGPYTGDVSWAFQWDLTIPAGGSITISKDKNFIPEPSAAALLLAGLALLRRR